MQFYRGMGFVDRYKHEQDSLTIKLRILYNFIVIHGDNRR